LHYLFGSTPSSYDQVRSVLSQIIIGCAVSHTSSILVNEPTLFLTIKSA